MAINTEGVQTGDAPQTGDKNGSTQGSSMGGNPPQPPKPEEVKAIPAQAVSMDSQSLSQNISEVISSKNLTEPFAGSASSNISFPNAETSLSDIPQTFDI